MLDGYKTKIVGWSMFVIAILHIVVDILDGGDFNYQLHFAEVYAALTGLGFVFQRKAIDKIEKK